MKDCAWIFCMTVWFFGCQGETSAWALSRLKTALSRMAAVKAGFLLVWENGFITWLYYKPQNRALLFQLFLNWILKTWLFTFFYKLFMVIVLLALERLKFSPGIMVWKPRLQLSLIIISLLLLLQAIKFCKYTQEGVSIRVVVSIGVCYTKQALNGLRNTTFLIFTVFLWRSCSFLCAMYQG